MNAPLFSLRAVYLPASGSASAVRGACGSTRRADALPLAVAESAGARLDSITLEIPFGATAVVGLSGAGKTSLLNVLAGFETEFSGEVKFNFPNDSANRMPLFWVPQSGGLWPHLSAEQHLDIVSNQQSARDSARFSKRTDELLSLFDLQQRQKAFPAELSQGERSRLALARALASRAKVLLLDEPLSHVDPVRKPGYWKIVRQFVEEENITMVFTSHEPETVLRHADHVICLDAGTVAFEGSTRTLYDHPPNRQMGEFLGPLNWFSNSESVAFLNDRPETGEVGIRPERLQISVAAGSGLELESMPFVGSYCESIIRHVATGTTKSVLHQLPEKMPLYGDRVMLHRLGATV